MATQSDVRRIALALPSVVESKDRFAFDVLTPGGKGKGIAWVWLERLAPKQARVPNPKVLAIRVADQGEKAMLLAADPDKFFTEDHYNGYPAVLVRLANVTVPELRKLIGDAWRCQAPKSLLREPPAMKTKTKTKTKRRRAAVR
jgi:hypothetical protein